MEEPLPQPEETKEVAKPVSLVTANPSDRLVPIAAILVGAAGLVVLYVL